MWSRERISKLQCIVVRKYLWGNGEMESSTDRQEREAVWEGYTDAVQANDLIFVY